MLVVFKTFSSQWSRLSNISPKAKELRVRFITFNSSNHRTDFLLDTFLVTVIKYPIFGSKCFLSFSIFLSAFKATLTLIPLYYAVHGMVKDT